MDVSITQFRRELFDLVGRAAEGTEVFVIHRGRRFKLQPVDATGDRLSRVTPLSLIEPSAQPDQAATNRAMLDEMVRSWEQDWTSL